MSKNSNHALNVLQFNLLSTFACISNPGVFLPVWASTTSALFNSLPIMKGHREHTASMGLPLCITRSWSALQEFIQIAHNMFWMVLKCAQVIVPIKAHVKYMWESFMDGAGGGRGRAVHGQISGVWNTCYILPLQTLITVFISFLCNLFSFMVELTQVSRVQWFNTHVSFTCLVKCSKAQPFSNMSVSLASLTINGGLLLIPIYNLHFLSSALVFQGENMFEKHPWNHSLKTRSMYMHIYNLFMLTYVSL